MCAHSGAGGRGDRQQEPQLSWEVRAPSGQPQTLGRPGGAGMTLLLCKQLRDTAMLWTCLRAGKGLTDQAVAGRSPARDLSARSF